MTWAAVREHTNGQLEDYAIEMLRNRIPQRLEQFRQGYATAVDEIEFWHSRILLARGPDFLRAELQPLQHVLVGSVAAYLRSCVGDHPLAPMLLVYANATNVFEISGFEVAPHVLESFRPFTLRVTTHHDDMPERHWTKGLVSLALGERWGWAPIAGFAPLQDVPFVPRAKFEFNVQALIAHLGGAILAEAPLSEVLPAWHQFMVLAVTLMDVRLIDESVILWVARIVFHHIGQEPLSSVGEHVFEEINQLIAAGR